ncbi:MAG TPA: hypothetical protein VG125_30000 [Pirellulales bacterium]|jgi:hypothetical protein|nr:hypothetical protein [Pirellulales bacterium]
MLPDEGDHSQTDPETWWPVEVVEAELVELPPANQPFGVPTRFGIGTLLVVTAAYSALLALLGAVGWNKAAIVWLVVFISIVGVAQMLLFGSRRPREASILAGALGLPSLIWLVSVVHRQGGFAGDDFACLLVSAVVFGAPAGYLAGGVVAGVFLIMDAVQRQLTRLSRADQEPPT